MGGLGVVFWDLGVLVPVGLGNGSFICFFWEVIYERWLEC